MGPGSTGPVVPCGVKPGGRSSPAGPGRRNDVPEGSRLPGGPLGRGVVLAAFGVVGPVPKKINQAFLARRGIRMGFSQEPAAYFQGPAVTGSGFGKLTGGGVQPGQVVQDLG